MRESRILRHALPVMKNCVSFDSEKAHVMMTGGET
jgi:hypothetical protein